MQIQIILLIIFTHFCFDWLLQSRYEAENKSRYFHALLQHLLTQAVGLAWVGVFLPGIVEQLIFIFVNVIIHGVQDKYIWTFYRKFIIARLNYNHKLKEEFEHYNLYARDYWFYSTIAVDQMLHLIVLFLTFHWLS